MSIIDAAEKLLKEKGTPLPSREIASEALERGWVVSKAIKPEQSLTNTIDKMIREKTTDRLKYVTTSDNNRKLVALIDWDQPLFVEEGINTKELRVVLTNEQSKILNLMLGIGMASSEKEALNIIIKKGISHILPQLKNDLNKTIETLED